MRRESLSLEHEVEEEEEEEEEGEEGEGEGEEEEGISLLGMEEVETPQRNTSIPEPVFTLFAFLARQGIHISDLFRRPGNISQMKVISSSLAKGEVVDWSAYNVYTVANVAKRFLLSVPGGIFGEHNERRLLVAAVPPSTPHSPHPPPSISGTTSASTTASSARHRLPSKLQHAPGFQTPHVEMIAEGSTKGYGGGREGGGDVFVSSPFTDRTGFLCDFGMLPPSPVEMDQIDLFIEILDTLPPPCRELAIIIFGILHSMVRHAGFEVTTGCYSCTPSTPSRTSSSLLRAPQTSSITTPPPPPPIRTLAEAVSKSVAGALLHTCPLSVDMVDRGSQVMQTLILRYAHLGNAITTYYTDLLLGHVCSNLPSSPTSAVIPSMSQVVSSFIVPPSSTARIRKSKGKKTPRKSQGVEEAKYTPPVGRILALASRLLCLTRSRLGGEGERSAHITPHSLASTTSSPSSIVSVPPPRPSATPTKFEGIIKVPVTAAVAEAPPAEPKDVCEENHDSPKEETDDSDGAVHPQILTRSYIRRSHSRYRAVHRRQMEAMLRRTAWFLGSNTTTATATTAATTTTAGTTPQLVVTSAGMPYTPTSTQSLLEIGSPLDFEEQRHQFQQLPHSPEGLAVPFYLSPLPRISVTSIRSAPTCQESPATPCQADSGEEGEEGEEILVEEQSRSIPRPK
ncbi:unnamed protein product [Taenia asiatica]|uniref:Rho-GAP domain-containing protein n=1 Tax=Taenia asiatica TaxID=60517 RepID=A0A158R8X9_TAEAS|nr:unnamed protein product [Taenia asiatica]